MTRKQHRKWDWTDPPLSPKQAIEKASGGDIDSCHEVLFQYVQQVEANPYAPILAKYVAAKLREILEGEDAKQALGLVRRGRPRRSVSERFERDFRLALEFRRLRDMGNSWESARRSVADLHNVSESEVERAHRRVRADSALLDPSPIPDSPTTDLSDAEGD